MTPDEMLSREIAKYFFDPLGYVMFAFPWTTDPSIQMVTLQEPYASRYNSEFGPDKWFCEFLEELGEEIKKRSFNGRDSVDPIRFSTASGHGIGKSAGVAMLIKYILDTRPFSKGVVTANTSDQLRTKTWAELAKWNSISITNHLWHYTSGRGSMSIYRKGSKRVQNQWRCDAMTCKEENAEAFQGLHAANSTPFYIFDEASGIPAPIWEARYGGATDGEPMSFDFGNPTRKSGHFFENTVGRFKHRHIVRKIDSRSVAITNKKLIGQWMEDWGEDSDLFKVKVKGEFPSAGSVQFIPSDDVRTAMARPGVYQKEDPLVIGVDVARFGEDSTVVYPRIGCDAKSFKYKEYKGLDTMGVVEKVIDCIKEFAMLGKKCSGLFIDEGYNPGVVDLLRTLGYNPISVNFGRASANQRYRYVVDQMWGTMKDEIKLRLALPTRDEKIEAQLTQREYGFTTTGKIALESKRDMKDRGIPSPDIVDALALTYFSPVATVEDSLLITPARKINYDFDPLEGDHYGRR